MKNLYLKIILILLSFIYIGNAGIDDGIFKYYNNTIITNYIKTNNFDTLISNGITNKSLNFFINQNEPYDILLSEKYKGKITIGTNNYQLKHYFVTNITEKVVLEEIK